VPADTINADLRYAFPTAGLVTGLRLTHAQNQQRIDVPELDPTTRFDGYSITDVYANWSPAALPQLRFDLNINNLTDEFYQRAWDQLAQPGREIILSAVYRF
jgi:hemoglobin/transferrin/lactoferrin receptor protein